MSVSDRRSGHTGEGVLAKLVRPLCICSIACSGSTCPARTVAMAEPMTISKLEPDPEYHAGGSYAAVCAAAA